MLRSRDEAAAALEDDLRERMVPFWAATLDRRGEGFHLAAEERAGPRWLGGLRIRLRARLRPRPGTAPSPGERHVVGQSRAVFALALAARLGYDPGGRALAAADAGCRFLVERLADREHGGFVWTADRSGRPRVADKLLYGQAFALLALVESHRATGERRWLDEAIALARFLAERFADRAHGGWHEHLGRDLRPLDGGADLASRLGRTGWKSHDGHLHVTEALAELLAVTGDAELAAVVRGSADAAARFLRGADGPPSGFRRADWSRSAAPAARSVLYGHLFEHAWLWLRIDDALGTEPRWDAMLELVGLALRHGFDHRRGGVLKSGLDAGPPSGRVRESWAQAEGLVALALAATADPRLDEPLRRELDWVLRRHRTARGPWLAALDADGSPLDRTLAGSWKAGYHEVRSAAFTAAVLRGDRAPWRGASGQLVRAP